MPRACTQLQFEYHAEMVSVAKAKRRLQWAMALSACALLVGLCSYLCWIEWTFRTNAGCRIWHVVSFGGFVEVERLDLGVESDLPRAGSTPYVVFRPGAYRFWFHFSAAGDPTYCVNLGGPCWVPIAACLIPTGFLSCAYRRAKWLAGPPRCTKCRYDRTGLGPGAACPECGTISEAKT